MSICSRILTGRTGWGGFEGKDSYLEALKRLRYHMILSELGYEDRVRATRFTTLRMALTRFRVLPRI
jgi:hypothetical protein